MKVYVVREWAKEDASGITTNENLTVYFELVNQADPNTPVSTNVDVTFRAGFQRGAGSPTSPGIQEYTIQAGEQSIMGPSLDRLDLVTFDDAPRFLSGRQDLCLQLMDIKNALFYVPQSEWHNESTNGADAFTLTGFYRQPKEEQLTIPTSISKDVYVEGEAQFFFRKGNKDSFPGGVDFHPQDTLFYEWRLSLDAQNQDPGKWPEYAAAFRKGGMIYRAWAAGMKPIAMLALEFPDPGYNVAYVDKEKEPARNPGRLIWGGKGVNSNSHPLEPIAMISQGSPEWTDEYGHINYPYDSSRQEIDWPLAVYYSTTGFTAESVKGQQAPEQFPITDHSSVELTWGDDTLPTVADVWVPAGVSTYYPGQKVPIVVEFSEPVYSNCYEPQVTPKGKIQLAVNGQWITCAEDTNVTCSLSDRRTFYYTVPQEGGDKLQINGIRLWNDSALPIRDMRGNPMAMNGTQTDLAYTLLEGKIAKLQDNPHWGVRSVTNDAPAGSGGVYPATQKTATVQFNLPKQYFDPGDVYIQPWAAWSMAKKQGQKLPFEAWAQLQDGTRLELEFEEYEFTPPGHNPENHYRLNAVVDLDEYRYMDQETTLQVSLYINGRQIFPSDPGATFTVTPVKKVAAPSTDQFIAALLTNNGQYFYATISDMLAWQDEAKWPAGEMGALYLSEGRTISLDVAKEPTAEDGGKPTYQDYIWEVGDKTIAEVIRQDLPLTSSTNIQTLDTLRMYQPGTTTLTLVFTNGSDDPANHTRTQSVPLKVVGGNLPLLSIPPSANIFYAGQGQDLVLPWSSNLATADPDGTAPITVALYAGKVTDFTGKTPVETWQEDRKATSTTVKGGLLQTISAGDEPAYTVRVSTTAADPAGKTLNLSAVAYLVVRSQPAQVALTGVDEVLHVGGKPLNVGWVVDNYDAGNGCSFSFTVMRGSEEIYRSDAVGSATGKTQQFSGAYALELPVPSEGALKEVYVLTARAKNTSDPTESFASRTLTVYRPGAVKLLVGGEDPGDNYTLKNIVQGEGRDPLIKTLDGQEFRAYGSAQNVADLRAALNLMQSIQLDLQGYTWSKKDDLVEWLTDHPDKVTINYRESVLYSSLDSYSYSYYLPSIAMMLCGLNDGESTVAARHARLSELSDQVVIDVERLENQLYLFQFYPADTTEVSYTDGKGNFHTYSSNPDGSLVIYEPDGIAGDLYAASDQNGVYYKGTIPNAALKSGERDGTKLELYPINTLELREMALAELTLITPEGTPYADQPLVLRGGVYRNGTYIEGARFASARGASVNLDGKTDLDFRTDANGLLTVYMDIQQFDDTSDHSDPVTGKDDLQFIFELQFKDGTDGEDEYLPALAYVDGKMNPQDVVRAGDNLLTLDALRDAPGIKRPFVGAQWVDYGTGRTIDVRRHTGALGPNANYPEVELTTLMMMWGGGGLSSMYKVYMMDEYGVKPQAQTSVNFAYPFSSIPIVRNVLTLSDDTMWWENQAREYRRLRLRLDYSPDVTVGGLTQSFRYKMLQEDTMPFKVVNLTKIEKIQESDNLLALMANISAWGSAYGADSNYKWINATSDAILKSAISFLGDMGAEAGLVKSVLTPTEDPTRFLGYFWTGLNTTGFEDLDYDRNGVCVEPNFLQSQFNDTLSPGDFKAMADGSYFKDRSSLYAAASGVIGIPIMLQLEGWVKCELRYNFDKMEWEVLTTGGGFTAGTQLEYERNFNFKPMGVPLTASFRVRGGLQLDFKMAVRYAEQLGLEWNDQTARAVNDYLTALRTEAYLEAFGGLGHDKGFTLKFGLFGTVDINNENLFLSRTYLKDPSERQKDAQYLQVDGETGVKVAIGAGPVVAEVTLASVSAGDSWYYDGRDEWNAIQEYWEGATDGLGDTGNLYTSPAPALYAMSAPQTEMQVLGRTVRLQSRDYLADGQSWHGSGGGDRPMLFALLEPEHNLLKDLQTNAYPYSYPLITDDGALLVYLSDAGSADVADVEVRYSQAGPDGSFPDGAPIPTNQISYGDSSLDLDGGGNFAAAAWVRTSHNLDLPAGSDLNESQQALLVNSFEIMAAVWDGTNWTTTAITANGAADLSPVVAVGGDRAIVAWRSVQGDAAGSIFDFTAQDRILYKTYDKSTGTWSEAHTLYNGSGGLVRGLDAELLSDGTAAVSYVLDTGRADDPTTTDLESGYEVFYGVIGPNDAIKTVVQLTADAYLDESPRLATAAIGGAEHFFLGWHSYEYATGVDRHDLRLAVFDRNGAPRADFPDSLGGMMGSASFNGQFAFVRGAGSVEDLSVLWNDAGAGQNGSNVLRAVKFGRYNGQYISSAPIEVAELPSDGGTYTQADHFDARAGTGNEIMAVIQGTQRTIVDPQDPNTFKEEAYEDPDGDGPLTGGTVRLPKETVNLYTAREHYANTLELSRLTTDFTSLRTNAPLPLVFTVANRGMAPVTNVKIEVGGAQLEETMTLMPGEWTTLTVNHMVGAVVTDVDYTVTATFDGGDTTQLTGTVYLDYPDVGISALRIAGEDRGVRELLVTLYEQAAATLAKGGDRRVALGVYSDPDCTLPVDGKYFNAPDGLTISDEDALTAMENGGYTVSLPFDLGSYVTGAGLEEVPADGVTLFLKATVEETKDSGATWIVLPEADEANNLVDFTLDSLLTRSGGAPVTTDLRLDAAGGVTTANVTVRNNSLTNTTTGNLVVSLLDGDGKVLETKQSYDSVGGLLHLNGEESAAVSFTFSQAGASVKTSYGNAVLSNDANAAVASISLEGAPLSLDSFDAQGSASLTGLATGSYALSVVTEDPRAVVTVNGVKAEGGAATVTYNGSDATVAIVVTAADGSTRTAYNLFLRSRQILPPDTPAKPVKPEQPQQPDGWDNPFTDVHETDWFYEAVKYAYENGLFNGTSATAFSPRAVMTRAMLVTVLHRMEGAPAPKGDRSFTDVGPGKWYTDAVLWAAENGIVDGYGDGRFGPDDPITREQLAAILYRYMGSPATAGSLDGFTDASSASGYAADALRWAVERGILTGKGSGTLDPKGQATRAEVAAVLMRLLELEDPKETEQSGD